MHVRLYSVDGMQSTAEHAMSIGRMRIRAQPSNMHENHACLHVVGLGKHLIMIETWSPPDIPDQNNSSIFHKGYISFVLHSIAIKCIGIDLPQATMQEDAAQSTYIHQVSLNVQK